MLTHFWNIQTWYTARWTSQKQNASCTWRRRRHNNWLKFLKIDFTLSAVVSDSYFKSVRCHSGRTYIFNFWHSGTLVLRAEYQSARMLEITNVG